MPNRAYTAREVGRGGNARYRDRTYVVIVVQGTALIINQNQLAFAQVIVGTVGGGGRWAGGGAVRWARRCVTATVNDAPLAAGQLLLLLLLVAGGADGVVVVAVTSSVIVVVTDQVGTVHAAMVIVVPVVQPVQCVMVIMVVMAGRFHDLHVVLQDLVQRLMPQVGDLYLTRVMVLLLLLVMLMLWLRLLPEFSDLVLRYVIVLHGAGAQCSQIKKVGFAIETPLSNHHATPSSKAEPAQVVWHNLNRVRC